MGEEFVGRKEFDNLKQEVDKIKEDIIENAKVLQTIDKKIDVITERLGTSQQIDDLKIDPLKARVEKVENNQSWLWKAFGTALIGVLVKVVFDVSTHIK